MQLGCTCSMSEEDTTVSKWCSPQELCEAGVCQMFFTWGDVAFGCLCTFVVYSAQASVDKFASYHSMFPLFSGNGADTAAIISMPQWCSALRWYMCTHLKRVNVCFHRMESACFIHQNFSFMSSLIHLNLHNKIKCFLPGYPTCTTMWVYLMLFTECLCT